MRAAPVGFIHVLVSIELFLQDAYGGLFLVRRHPNRRCCTLTVEHFHGDAPELHLSELHRQPGRFQRNLGHTGLQWIVGDQYAFPVHWLEIISDCSISSRIVILLFSISFPMPDFNVTIRASGKQFTVRADETILSAALRQGIMLSYSCRNGSCGSCQGRVLQGQVHYPQQPPQALNQQQLAAGEALLCQAVPQSDLIIQAQELDAVRDIPVRLLPARVQSRDLLAPNVARLRLKLPQGQRLQYLAGQYIDILLPGGERRAFSLANAPHEEAELELHVRHVEGGDFTEYVFHEMPERAIVRFEGPLGTFFLREDSTRPMLMMGGGTGYAPLKAMLEHALHSGLERSVHLFWGARNRAELYALEQARDFARASEQIRFDAVLSEPAPEDDWHGATGWVHEALLHDYAPELADYDVYMSGPPAMISAAREAFCAAGLPQQQLFYDSFDFAPRSGG